MINLPAVSIYGIVQLDTIKVTQSIGLTVAATALAGIAFTSNSMLARLALGAEQIDPASFTTVRTVAAAATLWTILRMQRRHAHQAMQVRMVGALLVYQRAGPRI